VTNNAREKKTVLIVDDDYSIRETLQEAVEYSGYSVITAANGKEGLEKMKTGNRPSLVLLDLKMPIMNGREFLDAVQSDASLSSVPVVVISSIANSKNSAGAKKFIKTPPDLDDFAELLDQNAA
jgi:two-component system chemotaxis response regulator CheY